MRVYKYLPLSLAFSLLPVNYALADSIDDTFNFTNTEVIGYSSASTNDDSTSMVVNPGGIGIKQDGEIFFSNSISNNFNKADLHQTNLFGTYSNFNLGFQQFTPRGKVLSPMRKFIVGAGYPIFDGLSLGVSYSNIQTIDNTSLNTNSIDIGLLTRPTDFLSVGLVARNINNPILGKTTIARTYTGSLGIRPAAWDRLTLTIDGEWVEGSSATRIRGLLGLETEFIDGLLLKGRVSSDSSLKNIGWSLEAGVNFPFISAGYGKVFGTEVRDAAYAKLSLNKTRTMFEGHDSLMAEINMNGLISSTKNMESGLFGNIIGVSVYDYLEYIEKAKTDKSISGIVLNMNNFGSGLSDNEEIRKKLIEFKGTGKKIIAYVRSLDMSQYYLATVADKIVMHPLGEIRLQGVGGVQYFYKGLMDKVGIESQYVKIGKYKSATEPETRTSASESEKEQTNALLKDFYSSMSKAITSSRKLTEDQLKSVVDNETMVNPTDAKDLKLVDQIAYYDEIGKISAELMGKKGKYPLIRIADITYKKYNWKDENKIAVINASGAIVEGESTRDFLSGQTTIGAETIARMLDKARKDDDIKAVVLRVDSGGGSSIASEIISREVSRYKEDKKPIVISMANVAASGGYWITTDANKVVANENTITGSIGVYTGKLNISKLLEKLSVTTETYKIGEHADAFSETRPFTDSELKILQKSADFIYRTFLERVATGRKMTVAKVDELAQGRVYSGTRAKELKLIDEIGGIEKAIEIAGELAKLNKNKTEVINYASNINSIAQITKDPQTALNSLVMLKLFRENKILAIMPDFDLK